MGKKKQSATYQGYRGETGSFRTISNHRGNIFFTLQTFLMKLASWNIRGCSAPQKKRLLRRKIVAENLTVMFIQETKCSEKTFKTTMEKIWKGSESSDRNRCQGCSWRHWYYLEPSGDTPFKLFSNPIYHFFRLSHPWD